MRSHSDLNDWSLFDDILTISSTLVPAELNIMMQRHSPHHPTHKRSPNPTFTEGKPQQCTFSTKGGHSINTAGSDITQVPRVREQAEQSSILPRSRAVI